jgi:hypothetical protein
MQERQARLCTRESEERFGLTRAPSRVWPGLKPRLYLVPTVHRLRIGSVDCALLNDGDLPVAPEILFPREHRELWPPVETTSDGSMVISVICLVIWSDGQVVLVDTCAKVGWRPRFRMRVTW